MTRNRSGARGGRQPMLGIQGTSEFADTFIPQAEVSCVTAGAHASPGEPRAGR